MSMSLIYIVGMFIWPLLWLHLSNYEKLKQHKILYFPLSACIIVLLLNSILSLYHGNADAVEIEESLFEFLDKRTANINSVVSGILVITAVIYSVGDRKIPSSFMRYIAATYISFVGFMTPVIWIPTDRLEWLRLLRSFQTVPFTFGVFFAVTAILIIIKDVMSWLGKIDEKQN